MSSVNKILTWVSLSSPLMYSFFENIGPDLLYLRGFIAYFPASKRTLSK